MKSSIGPLAIALVASCAVMAAGPSTTRAAAASALTLVHQDLALDQDAPLVVQVHPGTALVPGDVVHVLAYQPVTDREGLRRAIGDDLTGPIDRVELDPAVDPASVVTGSDGTLTITVPTESDSSTKPALRLSSAGLYPLAVQVLDAAGAVSAQVISFVDRMPAAGIEGAGSIGVAMLATVSAPPRLPGATTPLPADVTAALTELSRYPAGLPISLSISPETLGRVDPALLAKLAGVLTDSVIMSQPSVPLDPSAATAAGLDKMFTQRLVDGESAIAATGELPPTSRTVWFAPDGLSNDGALLLRNLGVRLLVIPSDTYLHADGNNGALTDYSQLFQTVLSAGDTSSAASGGTTDATSDSAGDVDEDVDQDSGVCAAPTAVCIPTAAIDPVLAGRLTDSSLSDEQAALYTAADLVAYRDFFADSLSPTNRHAIILGLDGQGVANAQRMSRTMAMATATGATNFITIDQFEQNSGQSIADGRQLELQLPQPTPVDLSGRAATLDKLAAATPSVSSMLVDDKGRTARWNATIEMLYSSAISDADADAAVTAINDQLFAVMACVVPPTPYTFTLTGRSTNLPLRLTNSCDESLNVVVHLQAAAEKMDFPKNDVLQRLDPGPNDFKVPVTARTNGTFDVSFDVVTPQGTPQGGPVAVTPRVTIRARINTLTGLPQVITGAGLLILLTWWVRNQRRSRRARRTAAAMNGTHPVTGLGGATSS